MPCALSGGPARNLPHATARRERMQLSAPSGHDAAMHPFPRMRWVAAAWMLVWAPVHASVWGFRNFLHLCDIAVILTCAGLWSGSALLLSSQALFSIGAALFWDLDV